MPAMPRSKSSPSVESLGPLGPWFIRMPCSEFAGHVGLEWASGEDFGLLLSRLLQRTGRSRGQLLLESIRSSDRTENSRYSFWLPSASVWRATRGQNTSDWEGMAQQVRGFAISPIPAEFPPFVGGAAGLLSFDWCRALERVRAARRDQFQTPALAMGIYDRVLAVDHRHETLWMFSTGYPLPPGNERRDQAVLSLTHWWDQLSASHQDPGKPAGPPASTDTPPRFSSQLDTSDLHSVNLSDHFPEMPSDWRAAKVFSSWNADEYQRAVERSLEYLRAGDIFQVNLAQQLVMPWRSDAYSLYRRMQQTNSAPFAAYFDMGHHQLISASPERLVRVRGDQVETCPIKGTRRLNANAPPPSHSPPSLRDSVKDCAENVMIVDLLRNDLSQVCRPESIRVRQLCGLENYRHVQHLVSVVEGELESESDPWSLLPAVFPGGSISGAPKVRALEIIQELEPYARGAYCGSLGYIGFPDEHGQTNADWNILIRTATLCGGWCQIPVGGGIVLGSEPTQEYRETWDKARGLLLAVLGGAESKS
jgi:para-aminobenzoate synthetase component 1